CAAPVGRHLAIVDPLLVRPFRAKPLLAGPRCRCFGGAIVWLRILGQRRRDEADKQQRDHEIPVQRWHGHLLECRFPPRGRDEGSSKRKALPATRYPARGRRFQMVCRKQTNGRAVMISRRSILLISAAFLSGASSAAWAASRDNPIKMFDTDADGTLDLMEVKKAASALFAKLDPDHDGTLDRRELRGRLSARELAAADPDHDGTLTLDEYLAVVEQRFNAANPDRDGTLDAKELNTPAGRALLRLLR